MPYSDLKVSKISPPEEFGNLYQTTSFLFFEIGEFQMPKLAFTNLMCYVRTEIRFPYFFPCSLWKSGLKFASMKGMF